ncbi:MAG: carbohydrate binding family 9 domain-containing protein, partial [Gemmatimonadota bacterium]|nr:carbohydrate binding family 9 domain-containing protein [Gemmatimonadota bacterium]
MKLLLVIVALASAPLLAQQQATPGAAQAPHSDAPRATAARLEGTIRIDGQLSETQWQSAQPLTQFTQLDPAEGRPATERSDIRILYDDEALYIGAMLYDRQATRGRLGRRDMSMSASDWLTVILDTSHDHRTAVGFEVNPLGVRRDQTRSPSNEDDSWEPVWQVQTSVTDSGWVAEMRIPFSQLRFTGDSDLEWGLQVERQIARNQEFSVWSFTPREQPGGIPRFGHLTGMTNLGSGKRVEIMPYVVGRSENIDRSGNPFRDNNELGADGGLDLKYRVTSNMTLDATVNPDFGQVEVDPAVINLTAFETFFPERRPFFVEGSELFNFGADGTNSVFYSRRIGRRPSLTPQYAERDVPEATSILGAVKLTGRTGGGWAMGLLDAVTGEETARFRTVEGVNGEQVAEPLTNYFAGRLRREAREGQTAVGAFLGAVNRDDLEGALSGLLRKAAYTGGLDFSHQWAGRTWTLRGFAASSHVRGDEAAIIGTQRLPYHYFQRPDADHLEVDSTATSLTGFAGSAILSHRIGRLWNMSGRMSTFSPDYEISDLGFQRRGDRIDVQTNVNYTESRPGRFRRYQGSATALSEHNYDWQNVSNRLFLNGFVQFHNYWSSSVNFSYGPAGTVDDRLTRGGPAAYRPGHVRLAMNLSSDPRKSIAGFFGAFTQRGPGEGQEQALFAEVRLNPRANIELSLGPTLSSERSEAQFLGRVSDPLATRTFGSRYIFADLEQTTLSLDARLSYTFTPGLSLQVFAQPFIATGKYGATKEFAEPG